MEPIEAEAIERVRAGDPDAFRVFVDRYSRNVFKLAFRLTRNQHDADDVVQETFLRAYKHLHSFDSRSSFGTWIHRIAANSAFDLLRRRERNSAEELDPETAGPGHDDVVSRLGFRDALERGFSLLSRNERAAFVLRHYEGMSIAEIGEILGTETSATKNTIFRAVGKLRQVLQPLVSAT
ncbi:MAG: RNA polymerase sigma factor [Thermoanaerobaculia bacterium]